MPRIQVVRSFLMNRIYHHRGELIVYLRATGIRYLAYTVRFTKKASARSANYRNFDLEP